jgi:hypothetical protein
MEDKGYCPTEDKGCCSTEDKCYCPTEDKGSHKVSHSHQTNPIQYPSNRKWWHMVAHILKVIL